MQKSRNYGTFWLLAAPTVLLFLLSLLVTLVIRYPTDWRLHWGEHIRAFSAVYIIWFIIMFAHNVFDFSVLRRYTTLLFNLISSLAICFLAAVLYFYFQPDLILTPRRFLLVQIGITFVLLLAWYVIVKVLLMRRNPEEVYLLSLSSEQQDLAREITNRSYLGYEFKGYLKESDLGNVQLDERSSIVFPDELQNRPEVLNKFYSLRNHKVGFYSHHYFYEELTRRVDLSFLSEFWFLTNVNYQSKKFYNLIKRLFDFVFGILMLVAFAITFPFVAIAIKLSSSGKLFFIQERVGQEDKIFKVYKYRTMSGDVTNTWTMQNDPRITWVGKFLRRTRLDELPQFINLLEGNMSLVGPRPEQVNIVRELAYQIPFFDERHVVKPGITGWAQLNVYASNLEETKLKLQYDLYYIKHRSFLFDMEIILKTFYFILTGTGR